MSNNLKIKLHEDKSVMFTDEELEGFNKALSELHITAKVAHNCVSFKHAGVSVFFNPIMGINGPVGVIVEVRPSWAFVRIVAPIRVSCKYSDQDPLMEEAIKTIVEDTLPIAKGMAAVVDGLDNLTPVELTF